MSEKARSSISLSKQSSLKFWFDTVGLMMMMMRMMMMMMMMMMVVAGIKRLMPDEEVGCFSIFSGLHREKRY